MEIQLNALCTLLTAGILYWLGDWLAKRPVLRGRCPIPAPIIGAILLFAVNAASRAGGGFYVSFHDFTQGALVYIAAASLGLTIKASGGSKKLQRLFVYLKRQLGKNWSLTLPPLKGLRTTPGHIGTALSLILFCMFAGHVLMGSVRYLTGFSLPDWPGCIVLAILVRSTSELTEEEFPSDELNRTGRLSLGMFLTSAVSELPL